MSFGGGPCESNAPETDWSPAGFEDRKGHQPSLPSIAAIYADSVRVPVLLQEPQDSPAYQSASRGPCPIAQG